MQKVCFVRVPVLSVSLLALTACGGGGGNAQNNSRTGAAAAAINTAAAPAGNAAVNTAAAPPSDPGSATGPVALASDSSLPASCQEFVRKTQSCIDSLPEAEAATKAHNEWTLRTQLHSRRGTWALAQDDSYRTRLCDGDLEAFAREKSRVKCTG